MRESEGKRIYTAGRDSESRTAFVERLIIPRDTGSPVFRSLSQASQPCALDFSIRLGQYYRTASDVDSTRAAQR